MLNLDYWNTFIGEESPEAFMRNFGSTDPETCVSRFLEERGQLYGVVNQGSWVKTFGSPEQHHCLTVKVYLLSYLDENREEWQPALEANPPHTPRRYREKFDPDRFPPPGSSSDETSPDEEAGTYGTYIPDSDQDFGDIEAAAQLTGGDSAIEEDDAEPTVVTPNFAEVEEVLVHRSGDPVVLDVVMPDMDSISPDPDTADIPKD